MQASAQTDHQVTLANPCVQGQEWESAAEEQHYTCFSKNACHVHAFVAMLSKHLQALTVLVAAG